jgi:hypothetical protein
MPIVRLRRLPFLKLALFPDDIVGGGPHTMKTRIRATAVLVGLPAMLACCLSVSAPAAAAESAVAPLPASDYAVRHVCAAPAPGYAGCLAMRLVPVTAAARAHTHPLGITRSRPIVAAKPSEGAFGLRPQDLHSIYQLPPTSSATQTIAIVDAYNDLTIESDLETYDKEFGLPECTGANKCFEQVNQEGETGKLPFPASKAARAAEEVICETAIGAIKEAACKEVEEADGWAGEISLDVEVAHAVCQNCKIVLVEANSSSFVHLGAAEETAVRLAATEISDSWGGSEQGITTAEDDAGPFNHRGTVITVAAGDNGYLDWGAKESSERGFVDYPASSPNVVAVGGTRLMGPLGPGGTWTGETVWNGDGAGGGGCSTALTAPAWQQSIADWSSVGCVKDRAVADVSADADPYTGVAVYDSTPESMGGKAGWVPVGGTSLASPLIAATFALAGGAHGVAYPAQTLYENEIEDPTQLHDVVSGSNGECPNPFNETDGLAGCTILQEAASCSDEAICLAREGYDGPTGVGTPNGITAFEPVSEAVRLANETRRQSEAKLREAKLREEERLREESKAAAERAAVSNPGGSGSTGSGSTGSAAQGGSPGATSPSTVQAAKQPARISALTLTANARAAIRHDRPAVSRLAFSCALSLPATVRVTLYRRVRAGRHTRWRALPGSFAFNAVKGLNRRRLRGARDLAPGVYRLTLTPAGGTARSITIRVA